MSPAYRLDDREIEQVRAWIDRRAADFRPRISAAVHRDAAPPGFRPTTECCSLARSHDVGGKEGASVSGTERTPYAQCVSGLPRWVVDNRTAVEREARRLGPAEHPRVAVRPRRRQLFQRFLRLLPQPSHLPLPRLPLRSSVSSRRRSTEQRAGRDVLRRAARRMNPHRCGRADPARGRTAEAACRTKHSSAILVAANRGPEGTCKQGTGR